MNHAEKLQRMFEELTRRGVGAWTCAPPIYRLLWGVGIPIPPPHLSTFWFLFAFQGTCMALIGSMLTGAVFRALSVPLPHWLLLRYVVFVGGFYGLFMAGYYRRQARKLRLPLWEDYANDRESLEPGTR